MSHHNQMFVITSFVFAFICLKINGDFMPLTTSPISLSQRARVNVSEVCGPDNFDCRSGFNNTTCKPLGICQEALVCNGREEEPQEELPLRSWELSSMSSGCVVTDVEPAQPPVKNTWVNESARTLIVNGSTDAVTTCFTKRNASVGESFTLVFWLKADCSNCSVVEMTQTADPPIHLRVIGKSFCLDDAVCYPTTHLGPNTWTFVAIRVSQGALTIFLHDKLYYAQKVSAQNLFIGSTEVASISSIFLLYNVRFYKKVLTSSELDYRRTGLPPFFLEMSDCRCPPDFPDLVQADDSMCTDGNATYPRYYTSAKLNSPDVMLSNVSSEAWATGETGDIRLDIDLIRSYQITDIEILFSTIFKLPQKVSCSFLNGGETSITRFFVASAGRESYKITLSTLDLTTTVATYRDHVADQIRIVLLREEQQDTGSFVIKDIVITGRCDCNGNAAACNVTDNSYSCLCEANTHSEGNRCEQCQPNFFRKSTDFDCPNSCQCSEEGVVNAADQCDESGGSCKCKENVEGFHCDTCKPWTFGLPKLSAVGCTNCSCYQSGTTLCNNATGQCQCEANTKEPLCDECDQNNYGLDSKDGCRSCQCFTPGTVNGDESCSTDGQCHCKTNVEGQRCDECKARFYALQSSNADGCKPCQCNAIGTDHSTCDSDSGQCPCRGSVYPNRQCIPKILSVAPLYGPEAGGTKVTIKGQLLGNASHQARVYLGSVLQTVLEVNDDAVIFQTQTYVSGQQIQPVIKLGWQSSSEVINPETSKFSYKQNPVLDESKAENVSTFERGGCFVEFYGTNLNSAKNPLLEIVNAAAPNTAYYGECRHRGDHVQCVTPVLNSSTPASSGFIMTAVFDGVRSSKMGNIVVKQDPQINHMGNIEFQYPFENEITLYGERLLSACNANKYSVSIGVVDCAITGISNTTIECKPTGSSPGNQRKHQIFVTIGNIEKMVGTLEYLEFYETKGFIIIVSCIAAAIVVTIVLILVFCCCQCHRRRSSTNNLQTHLDNKNSPSTSNNNSNNYTELPCIEHTSHNNNRNGAIRIESVMREPKKGFINSEAENAVLIEEFLPHVEPGMRDNVQACYVGCTSFTRDKNSTIRGKHAELLDGTLQRHTMPQEKVTIKSVLSPLSDILQRPGPDSPLTMWANRALSESLRLRQLKHANVLSVVGIGLDQQRFHLLYPMMSKGTLKNLVSDVSKEFSVRDLLGFSQQVAKGVEFLTSKDVTHKDIAARNCMVDGNSAVKLGDAAFSWDFYSDEYVYDSGRERYLPVRWMAPESISDGYYDMRTDVWSFGILIWELLTRGCLPFHEVQDAGVKEYILQGYVLGKPETLSDAVYDLLRNCWSPENASRPTIRSVSKTLGHLLKGGESVYENSAGLAFSRTPSISTPRSIIIDNQIYSSADLSHA